MALNMLRRRRIHAAKVHLDYRRLRQNQRAEKDPFNELTNREFIKMFRLSQEICLQLVLQIAPHMKEITKCDGISKRLKILCAIRFYATGSYQAAVGQDLFMSMSQSSVSRCVKEVSESICCLGNTYIKFPDKAAQRATKIKFMQKFNIGGVIGLVDGTHISILRPPKEVEFVYFAVRKSCHTKNVQIVCDFDLRILTINARFGGSAHDSFVWSNSATKQKLLQEYEDGERNSYLLGDSGYGQQPWLLVPIANPRSPAEAAYNATHQKCRHPVERCIGLFKSRFRCLCRQRVLMYSPEAAGTIINACAILHNILIEAKYPLPPEEEITDNIDVTATEPIIEPLNDSQNIRNAGIRVRDNVVRQYF